MTLHWPRLAVASALLLGGLGLASMGPRTGAAGGAAQLPPLIPRETFFGNPERTSPKISPDGARLLYRAPDANGVLQVWVRTLGQDDDRQVTNAPAPGPAFVLWGYDSRRVIYLQDREGNEDYHIYAVDLANDTVRDLTPLEGVTARPLQYVPAYPNEMLVVLNQRDPRFFDVYRLDLASGALTLVEENPGDVDAWDADRQLRVRAATVAYSDGGGELKARSSPDAPWRTLHTWGPDDSLSTVGFSPDGRALYLRSSLDANAQRLLALDLASGAETVLAADPLYDVVDALTDPVSGAAQAALFLRERFEWEPLDPAIAADLEFLKGARRGHFPTLERDLAGRTWIVGYETDDGPSRFYAYRRAGKASTLEFLFTTRPELESLPLARMEPISYQARDGLTIHGYLTLPVGLPARDLPTVLLVHGGPASRDVWGFDPLVQWLANRGYAVLQVNFRGSWGYGKDHLNAGNAEWGGKMHDDLLDGVAWLVGQGVADPRRVAIMGGSYGGYATLVGLAFTPEVFAAGVDIVGPSNLITLQESIPPYWELGRAQLERQMGGSPTSNAEFLRARSPLFSVERIIAPLLIAQGANDPRVKQAESEQMVAAMRAAGRPVQYVLYPDEGHGFARPENRLHFYGIVDEFLARHLGGRAEPARDVPGHSGIVQ